MLADESMLADVNRITDVIEQLVDAGSKYEKEYKIIPDSPIYTKREWISNAKHQ